MVDDANVNMRRWGRPGIVVLIIAVDLLLTLSSHHAPGTAASLGEIVGWVVCVVLTVGLAVVVGRRVAAGLHALRVRRTYRALLRNEPVG
jgi:hypothetical protein